MLYYERSSGRAQSIEELMEEELEQKSWESIKENEEIQRHAAIFLFKLSTEFVIEDVPVGRRGLK